MLCGNGRTVERGKNDALGSAQKLMLFLSPIRRSALHMIEGNGLSCTGAVITNNQLGPAYVFLSSLRRARLSLRR